MPEAVSESTELEVGIKANPGREFAFLLWNSCGIVMDPRNSMRLRKETVDLLEDALHPYWDEDFKKFREAIVNGAEKNDDLHNVRMRFRNVRGLMFRRRFDGERDIEYEDDDL